MSSLRSVSRGPAINFPPLRPWCLNERDAQTLGTCRIDERVGRRVQVWAGGALGTPRAAPLERAPSEGGRGLLGIGTSTAVWWLRGFELH